MKGIIKIAIVLMILCVSQFTGAFSSETVSERDNINVEPIPHKPRHYSVSIKFSTIDMVSVRTNLSAESLGKKHERFCLSNNEWSYDPDRNILVITRDIDDSLYIIRVIGNYQTPLCITLKEKLDPASIRFVVDGRIGVSGRDYRYDSAKKVIELMACKTGREKYIIHYGLPEGSASIGSAATSDLTRNLLAYLHFPIEGNAVCIDNKGLKFSPRDIQYKSVWLVQAIPAGDGYSGRDLLSGFRWNAVKNELVLDEPVDIKRFTIMIYGEFD